MRISDWSSDVCSSDLSPREREPAAEPGRTLVEPVLNEVAAEMRPRRALFVGCQAGLSAWAEAGAVRQIVQHLVANAIDASAPDAPVQVVAVAEQGRVRIERSEERRVGKECGSTFSPRGSRYHKKKK